MQGLYFFAAWGLIILALWSIWTIARDMIRMSRRMHQIPCSNCLFFTNSYYLKCPVHPDVALTEEAIDCRDYSFRD